jgi:amino acid permease
LLVSSSAARAARPGGGGMSAAEKRGLLVPAPAFGAGPKLAVDTSLPLEPNSKLYGTLSTLSRSPGGRRRRAASTDSDAFRVDKGRWASLLEGEFTTTVKGVIGSGFFALPYAIKQAGLEAGGLMVVMVGVMTLVTTKQLVEASRLVRQQHPDVEPDQLLGFLEIGVAAFGERASAAVSFSVFCSQFSAVLTYMVFMGSILTPVLSRAVSPMLLEEQEFLHVSKGTSRSTASALVMIGCVLLQIALAMLPDPSYMSTICNVGNLGFVVCAVYMVVHGLLYTPPDFARNTEPFVSFDGLWACFGIVSFTLSAHAECLSIHQSAGDEGRENYKHVVDKVYAVATVLYLAVSVFAYACFGEQTRQIVLDNYANAEGAAVMQVSMAAMIASGYPLSLFPVHMMVEEAFQLGTPHRVSHDNALAEQGLTWAQKVSRSAIVVVSGLLAFLTGDKFAAVSQIGGAFIGFLAFVLPPLMHVSLTGGWGKLPRRWVLINVVIISVGLAGSVLSLRSGFDQLFSHREEPLGRAPEPQGLTQSPAAPP